MLKPKIRTTLAVLHDAVAAVLAWNLAYLLRFNFELPTNFAAELQQTLYWVVPLELVIFWRFNLYRGIWRYASTADLRRIFPVSYTHLRAHETVLDLVCRLLLEKKKKKK